MICGLIISACEKKRKASGEIYPKNRGNMQKNRGRTELASVRPLAVSVLRLLLAVGGDVGCSLGPWIAGIVSDVVERSGAAGLFTYITQNAEEAGLRSGILTAAVFPLLMLTGMLLLTGWVKTDGNKEKATTEK